MGAGDDDLVIGEAVVLDLHPASFATRMGAIALDLLVLLVLGAVVGLLLGGTSFFLDQAAFDAIALGSVVVLVVGLPALVETFSRGRSLGKLALGLRVVRDDGGPIRSRHAFIRALAGIGEFFMTAGSVAIIASLANGKGKRVGDMLAGTYVVNERVAKVPIAPVVMPPELAGWAATADIGRLPDRLAMAVRQFLGRAERLHPGSRVSLGTSLAAQVGDHVAPPPPPGTHPERFLSAVLAERRRRELARLTREHQAARQREAVLHRLPHGMG
jgi:uncharacterized RDD family membrane protein YckC